MKTCTTAVVRTDSVGASAHARHQQVRLTTKLLLALLPCLSANDGLELAHL